jgi:hypothetical protein
MKKKYLLSAMCLVCLVAVAKAGNYPYLLIPDSLKKNASVVKRYEEMRVEIISADKAKIYNKYANTILNEAGDDYADYVSYYDKFNGINNISATLYDAAGKEIKHLKNKDIKDESGFDGVSLMDDNRLKKANFYCRDYPYTVEYEEEDEKNGIFYLSYWMPQENQHIAVEYSKLTVIVPANYTFHYRQLNYPGEPVITQASGKKVYTWEVKNVPAKLKEPFAPAWDELVTSVSLAPSDFKIGGYTGNMDSWKNFGLFINALMQGRNNLPEAVKQKVHELTDNVKTPEEKINVLYHFLQENTRYISVQLGIGGWQPFDANYVYNNKYGDCKALSNYMVAMLREAGIKANYVLINAKPYAHLLNADFPSTQFNHATVCVPLQKDTMWLECTSQTMPTGYISNFTGNRQAVLVDENGGHVVNTTRYTAADNFQSRNINAVIEESGKLIANVEALYKCLEQDDIHDLLHFRTKKEQLEELKKKFDIPTYDITSFDYKEKPSAKPVIEESLQLTADNYATVSGKRMFVMPNLLTKSGGKQMPDSTRQYDVYLRYGFTHADSIRIKIPQGYTMEAKPKDVDINNGFGTYQLHFAANDNEVICYRYFKSNEGRFPAVTYNDLVKFYNDIYKADRSRFVFVKKEG